MRDVDDAANLLKVVSTTVNRPNREKYQAILLVNVKAKDELFLGLFSSKQFICFPNFSLVRATSVTVVIVCLCSSSSVEEDILIGPLRVLTGYMAATGDTGARQQ